MTLSPSDERGRLRRWAYALLIITAVASAGGRILTVTNVHEETPFLSANDRSRWCTIRALVEEGTYAIDHVILEEGIEADAPPDQWRFDKNWNSIDKVYHTGPDGREHFYSSKPTLLTTLLAGVAWAVERGSGATLAEQPFYVARAVMLLVHLPALALMLWLIARLVERYGTTDWGRLFLVTAACFGTFLTTFAVTLNNHLIAAVSVAAALHAALAIWVDGDRRWWQFAISGFASAFAFANELPALAFLVGLGAALAYKSWRLTLMAFVPLVAVVLVAFFGTNYVAHRVLWVPYGFRGDGAYVRSLPLESAERLDVGQAPKVPDPHSHKDSFLGSNMDHIWVIRPGERWSVLNPDSHVRFILQRRGNAIDVHVRQNWYEFPKSYWLDENRRGIDRGEESRLVYAFHSLVGHHGIFSLTPLWLLALVGGCAWVTRTGDWRRSLALAVGALSMLCLAFYWSRAVIDRNYGGVSCGLRWMFWFAPLWLFVAIPTVDRLAASRLGRILGYTLLALSIASASYASLNPWSHPWPYAYMEYLRWVGD